MNGIGKRIENMRIAAGKTENEVADAVGMSTDEYWDLEAYDDEIIDVLSVDTAKRVATYFQLSLLQLLVPNKSSWPTKSIVSTVLVEKVFSLIFRPILMEIQLCSLSIFQNFWKSSG